MNDQASTPLAVLLRERRRHLGLSAREVAERAGVNVSTVTRIEASVSRQPAGSVVQRIAAVLGLHTSEWTAAATWLPASQLPQLRPYLRAKYHDLPDEAVAEVEALLARYSAAGPEGDEDERIDHEIERRYPS